MDRTEAVAEQAAPPTSDAPSASSTGRSSAFSTPADHRCAPPVSILTRVTSPGATTTVDVPAVTAVAGIQAGAEPRALRESRTLTDVSGSEGCTTR